MLKVFRLFANERVLLLIFDMDYDFQISPKALKIPLSAYRPIKRCPYCSSIYVNEIKCETCNRSMIYHPIGEPFSAKSFYGLKERYIQSFSAFVSLYPFWENKNSSAAKSYVRNLTKRIIELMTAFSDESLIQKKDRKLFYAESIELIDELLLYNVSLKLVQTFIEECEEPLILQELLYYIQSKSSEKLGSESRSEIFLQYKMFGVLRREFAIKTFLIMTTTIVMAIMLFNFVSLQFGK